MYHPIAGHICHSNPIFSQIFHFSSSTTITAILKSFKKKLAVGCGLSTPRSFKSYSETLASLLRRCCSSPGFLFGLALHGHAVKFGVSSDRSVFTKLLVMYSECGCPGGRDRVFAEFCGSDLFSWNFMINDLARGGDVDAACRLFDEMPNRNVVSWTVMISENMKTGRIGDAIWYFDRCPCHTVFSCTAMINGFVQNRMNPDALFTFRKMLCSGLMPNEITFTCLVRACIGIGELDLADNVVGMVIKTAFIRKLSVCNSLITLYVRLGDVGVARKLFDEMPERDVVSWTALLDVYFATGFLKEAHRIFDEMPERNEVTWGMMIARCNQHGEASEALRLFSIMLRDGYKPNLSCLASVISASASQGNLLIGASFHSHVTKVGFEDDVFVASSLIEMYSKCGDSDHARQIFDFLSVKNTVCWNAMIGGYCHDGKMEKAKDLLKKTPERDVASWNSMISGCVQNLSHRDVLETFDEMLASGQMPNPMTFSSVLLACANLPSLEKGKNVHAKAVKLGVANEVFVATALTDMYAKSGDIKSSKSIFSLMEVKNEVTWTAMIQGLADSGLAEESLALFEDLKKADISPTEPMFLSVFSACSHCGLVDRAFHYFESMKQTYGILPKEKHYTCMVDLLSRAGHLGQAEDFIRKMPIEPDINSWAALLSGCVIHGNDEIGEKAAKMVIMLEKQSTAGYVLLSNIYASAGRWKDVFKVRTLMRKKGLKKDGGYSFIQMRDRFHAFYSWDSNHPSSSAIYEVLELLKVEMARKML